MATFSDRNLEPGKRRRGAGANDRLPIDSARLVRESPGVHPRYTVLNADRSQIFAAKWELDDARFRVPDLTHGIVACRTSGTAMVTRRSGGRVVRRRPTIGSVTYIAPDNSAYYSADGSCEVFHVYLAPEAVRRFAATDLSRPSLPRIDDLFAAEDPWLKGYFQMLASEFELAEGDDRGDALFITQVEDLLIRHLLRFHSFASARDIAALHPARATNPLRPVTLKRIQDYIAANLAGDIALPDLAALGSMSIGHFLRAFRAAAGTTPYHYVLEERLRKASALLRTTRRPVSAIARDCGFKTVSQLSSKFHAWVGASPSHYRESRQSKAFPHRVPPHAANGADWAPNRASPVGD